MKTLISSDHGGYNLKKSLLESGVTEFEDLGPYELDPDDDFPLFAFPLAERVAEEGGFGVLICRSGNGMAIAANKVPGIRAAFCISAEHAIQAREHDHANILVLDSDYTDNDPVDIVSAFLKAEELEGRHKRRVDQITAYEQAA